jgi:hypothetical protein
MLSNRKGFRITSLKKDGMRLGRLALPVVCAALCMCNFATTSFNLGKLLLPGESMFTVSAGKTSSYTLDRQEDWVRDPNTGIGKLDTLNDTSTYFGPSAAIDYRLGVLSKYPFGKGVEIGFLIEYPVQMSRYRAPPLLQFDARLGLPMMDLGRMAYHHNMDIGWIVGGWVDNGWFAEYAAGIEIGKVIPYGNVRITRTPTDIFNDEEDVFEDEFLMHHNRRWNVRGCLGVSLQLPRWPIVPDFIVPEFAVLYPNALLKTPGISGHIGLRWQYGL